MKMGGGTWHNPSRIVVASGFSLRSKPDRREFLRGFLAPDETGNQRVFKFDRDGSGLISGLQQASCLIEIPESVTTVEIGQPLEILPLSEFGITV